MALRTSPSRQINMFLAAPALASLLLAGCSRGLDEIDEHVHALMTATSASVGGSAVPEVRARETQRPRFTGTQLDPAAERPPTVNPPAEALPFTPAAAKDAEELIERLEEYSEVQEENAIRLDLEGALRYAIEHSREHRFAEEEYVLSALRLLTERHRWGPRFFDDVSAVISGNGDDGLFDTSLRVVNDFQVTQRLPYGGEVSARALATFTEDLHQHVAGESVQSAEIILGGRLPLLRGAGIVAREPLIQNERNLIYGVRSFERFRREFLFEITRDFLDLNVDRQQIENAMNELESFQQLEQRQEMLYESGRATPFEWAEAKNETLEAIDRLNIARESARLALDRFKVRLGMPIEQPLVLEFEKLDLPIPRVDLSEAVRAAMNYRLDLQTRRDRVDDARRSVAIARNALLGDLDLTASLSLPTDPDQDRAGLDFDPGETSFDAGITYGLPLDREIERLDLRESQIDLARSMRDYDEFRDGVAIEVRAAAREIDSALFSFQIQQTNVEIAEQRQESIRVDPSRATIQQQTDAINQTARARDARDRARRDLEVAVLRYLLETGQLRVDAMGSLRPLPGMESAPSIDALPPAVMPAPLQEAPTELPEPGTEIEEGAEGGELEAPVDAS